MTTAGRGGDANGTGSGGPGQPIEELRFAVIGGYVMDCFVNTSRIPGWGEEHQARSVRTSPGGKALNQAVALARLGAQVFAVGVVGDDGVGRDILAALGRESIDTSRIQSRAKVPTAVCVCFVGDSGENAIVWHIDDEVAVSPGTMRDAAAVIRRADLVLVTFEMPQEFSRRRSPSSSAVTVTSGLRPARMSGPGPATGTGR